MLDNIVGHYRILEKIGTGGIGGIYKAEDTRLHRYVALKFFPERLAQDDPAIFRFKREAHALSALDHPNICTIYDIGEEEGQPFIVMQLLEGQTLRNVIQRGPLKLDLLISLSTQIADALEAAHHHGIIHRDIKPANIFVTNRDQAKIMDFGLAKSHSRREPIYAGSVTQTTMTEDMITSPGMTLGTVAYMSPEQARGQELDARTDLFSFGVVLYEMTTGIHAFGGSSTALIFDAILHKDPVSVITVRQDLPVQLEQIIPKAMEKDRELRYQTASDLRADLIRLKRDTDSSRKGAISDQLSKPPVRPGSSSSRVIVAVLSLAILMAAVGAIYRFVTHNPRVRLTPEKMLITKLTDEATVSNAALSPDGRYFAYISRRGAKTTLWFRQVASQSAVQLLPSLEQAYDWVGFSPDGDSIFFETERGDETALNVVPALGGVPRLVTKKPMPEPMPWGVGISPEGKRIAFIHNPSGIESSLLVAGADGTGERVIASSRVASSQGSDFLGFPNPPSWSPDGKLVGATSWWFKEGYLTAIRAFALNGAQPKLLVTSTGLAQVGPWLPDQSGFLLSYNVNRSDPLQIWFRPYPHGDLQRITNDLKDYHDLSVNSNGKLLTAVESETLSKTFVGSSANPERSQAVTTASKDGFALAWMPNGLMLLRNVDGEFSLMRPDGTNRIPLFRDAREWLNSVSTCGNGRYVVFASNREGNKFCIWRADSVTGALKRLTNGEGDLSPHCSSDGNWLIYNALGKKTPSTLQKVSIEGGTPSLLVEGEVYGARLSPDNKQLAAYETKDNQTKIQIFSVQGGARLKTFDLAPRGTLNYWDYSLLHWTPDGRALTYPLLEGDAMNLWRQPLSGGSPQQLTHFKELIFAYDWSVDGKQLAITRGSKPSDVVLISNFRE